MYLLESFLNTANHHYPNEITTTSSSLTTKKKPILSIDTSSSAAKPTQPIPQNSAPMAPLTTSTVASSSPLALLPRKRHCSISSYNHHPLNITPQLSPTSSVSSFSSNWSADSRRSHVEDMIHLFETGGSHKIHRRYSMDSHSYQKPLYIRERKYEYKPIASEWRKRTGATTATVSDVPFPVLLSASTST